MKVIKIRIRSESQRLLSQFDQSVSESIRNKGPVFHFSGRTWKPPTDVIETSQELILRVEIANVKPEDLNIEISPQAAMIKGRRIYGEAPEPQKHYHQAEIRYGSFKRIVPFPTVVDTKHVSASYAKGLLEIRLPKPEREKTYRIEIADK